MFLSRHPPATPVLSAFAELTLQLLSGGLCCSALPATDNPHSHFCFFNLSFHFLFRLHSNLATSAPGQAEWVQVLAPSLTVGVTPPLRPVSSSVKREYHHRRPLGVECSEKVPVYNGAGTQRALPCY